MKLFNDFAQKHKLKNNATSNITHYQVLSSLDLNNVDIYLREGPFSSDIGIVNLHPKKRTHWVLYIDEIYFDSYGCAPPQNLSKIIKKNEMVIVHIQNTRYKVLQKTRFFLY